MSKNTWRFQQVSEKLNYAIKELEKQEESMTSVFSSEDYSEIARVCNYVLNAPHNLCGFDSRLQYLYKELTRIFEADTKNFKRTEFLDTCFGTKDWLG